MIARQVVKHPFLRKPVQKPRLSNVSQKRPFLRRPAQQSQIDPRSTPWVAVETPDGLCLAPMHIEVCESEVDEKEASRLVLHVVAHSQCIRRVEPVVSEDPMYVRGVEDRVEILGA
jgi:hypothetical protein